MSRMSRMGRMGLEPPRRAARTPGRRLPFAVVAILATLATLSASVAACGPFGDDASPEAPWSGSWRYETGLEPVTARTAMVSTTDGYATEVGVAVLRDGGNAVDAAIAVSFALAVVNPEAGNIGGGGFLVTRMDGAEYALDYREKAPMAATRDMFLDDEGEVTDASVEGHLAAGVPGTVMGMWRAHERLGSLPWERLVEPAVELARGFEVTERFAQSLTSGVVAGLRRYDASAEAFLPGGAPPEPGDTLRQPDLARTLERIRDEGADGFYAGETADLIAAEMERGGGLITREDLAGYDVAWREPVRFDYRGYTVVSMPPSSSGGPTLAEAANILERYDLGSLPWDGADRVHLVAEAFRRAFADRNHYLADPDFVDNPLEVLTSDAYAAWRASTIVMDRATPSDSVGPGGEAFRRRAVALGDAGAATSRTGDVPGPGVGAEIGAEGTHTTHVSIVDGSGNAVALTTTVNSWYGSKVTVAGAGFILNNEMDDFTAKPGVPNQYGLVQGERNAVEPGKRMLSAMTPTLVLDPDGSLLLVTGTPGGSTIITTVFQVISNVVDYGMDVSDAVLAPRVHHQHLPDRIQVERDGLSPEVVAELEARGHRVVERGGVSGDVQAIVVAPDGTLLGRSDPRRGGVAAGY